MSGSSTPRTWCKSSFSGDGDCVEWNAGGERVLVRNSKDPSGAVLAFTRSEWHAFLAAVRAGEADLEAD